MPRYLVDTNHYIRAFNRPEDAARLRAFHREYLPVLWMSAVVLFEILAGARDEGQEAQLVRSFLEPFRSRGRLLVPQASTWRTVAGMERKLRASGGLTGSLEKRAFLGDMLIAASGREVGATLITENVRDFAVIRRVLAFRYVPDLPEPST